MRVSVVGFGERKGVRGKVVGSRLANESPLELVGFPLIPALSRGGRGRSGLETLAQCAAQRRCAELVIPRFRRTRAGVGEVGVAQRGRGVGVVEALDEGRVAGGVGPALVGDV